MNCNPALPCPCRTLGLPLFCLALPCRYPVLAPPLPLGSEWIRMDPGGSEWIKLWDFNFCDSTLGTFTSAMINLWVLRSPTSGEFDFCNMRPKSVMMVTVVARVRSVPDQGRSDFSRKFRGSVSKTAPSCRPVTRPHTPRSMSKTAPRS